jgi:hypothetical protein
VSGLLQVTRVIHANFFVNICRGAACFAFLSIKSHQFGAKFESRTTEKYLFEKDGFFSNGSTFQTFVYQRYSNLAYIKHYN